MNNGAKLSYKVINKIFENKMNKSEILFLLYIAKIQEETGHVSGLYYKQMNQYYKKLGFVFSYQSFYSAKESLEKKHIIKATSSQNGDWNVLILDNNFAAYTENDYENLKEKDQEMRYLNTNAPFFESKEFIELSAGAMLLAIDLYRQCKASASKTEHGTITRNVQNFYENYANKMKHYARNNKNRLQKRVLQNYLKDLKKFFNIHITNGNYKIKLLDKFANKSSKNLTSTIFTKHIAKTLIRRMKMNVNASDELDLENTIAGYLNTLKTYIKNAIKSDEIALEKAKSIIAFSNVEKQIKKAFKESNNTLSDKPASWKNRKWATIKKYAATQLHNSLTNVVFNA